MIYMTRIALFGIVTMALCGCGRDSLPALDAAIEADATRRSDAWSEWEKREAQERERKEAVWLEWEQRQAEDHERRVTAWEQSDALREKQEALAKRWESLLSKQEEQARRYDSILDKWETMQAPGKQKDSNKSIAYR